MSQPKLLCLEKESRFMEIAISGQRYAWAYAKQLLTKEQSTVVFKEGQFVDVHGCQK